MATTLPASTTSAQNDPFGGLIHTVVRGDTLWAIGQMYGRTVKDLASANGIVNVNRIHVGQKIKIPPAGFSSATYKRFGGTAPTALPQGFGYPDGGSIRSGLTYDLGYTSVPVCVSGSISAHGMEFRSILECLGKTLECLDGYDLTCIEVRLRLPKGGRPFFLVDVEELGPVRVENPHHLDLETVFTGAYFASLVEDAICHPGSPSISHHVSWGVTVGARSLPPLYESMRFDSQDFVELDYRADANPISPVKVFYLENYDRGWLSRADQPGFVDTTQFPSHFAMCLWDTKRTIETEIESGEDVGTAVVVPNFFSGHELISIDIVFYRPGEKNSYKSITLQKREIPKPIPNDPKPEEYKLGGRSHQLVAVREI